MIALNRVSWPNKWASHRIHSVHGARCNYLYGVVMTLAFTLHWMRSHLSRQHFNYYCSEIDAIAPRLLTIWHLFSAWMQQMMRLAFGVTLLIGCCSCIVSSQYGGLSIKYVDTKAGEPCIEWTGGTFAWPCKQTKALYKSSGKYISKNVIATRAQIVGDYAYVCLPRFKSGIPATVAKLNIRKGTCAAVLTPFPSWSMQEEGSCDALQSAVDIVADRNGIVWVLDVGVVHTLETPIRKCSPKVVAISTKTGKILKSISLEKLVTSSSRLQYLSVDYKSPNRVFLYVTDASQRSILVYDVQASTGFRVVLPRAVTSGCPKRDVLYSSLINRCNGTSTLYFTYLSSRQLFSIDTEFLRTANVKGRIHGKSTNYKCNESTC